MRPDRLQKPLIILAGIAVVLGIITYLVVFYNSGFVPPNNLNDGSITPIASSTLLGDASGTSSAASSSATSSSTLPAQNLLSWNDGENQLTINGVSRQDDKIFFSVTVRTGSSGECAPDNLRLIADEKGTLEAPSTPQDFGAGACDGTPNASYPNQNAAFVLNAPRFPLLFTTGGASNIFFEVATTTTGSLQIELPGNSG